MKQNRRKTVKNETNSMKKYLSITIVLLISIQLFGQNQGTVSDTSYIKKIELGEVVVNASRNATFIKDLPTSITMIRATELENNDIQSLEDINVIAPNFFMVNYGSKLTSPVYIRGIGSKKHSPAVGLYVDGVPFFEIASMNFDFFDIANIEVLRGPQGTLFGRNTMGGLINIETLSPIKYQGTRIRLSAGEYGYYNAAASYYNKTENNKIAYSLSANYRQNDGFFKNIYDNSRSDKLQSYGFRNRLAFTPNCSFSVENIASFENSTQSGYPYKMQNTEHVSYNDKSGYDRLMFNDGLRFDYNNDVFNLEATLAYQYIKDKQQMDQDFTEKPIYFADQDSKQNMLSSEITMNSINNKKYKWLFGMFAFGKKKDTDLDVIIRPKHLTMTRNFDEKVLSYGIFHQSELKLGERLTLTAGMRYNYEQTEFDYKHNWFMKSKLVKTLADTIYPQLKEHIFLPKFSVVYSIDNSSIYALYSTGYKPGGFNLTFERPQDLKFNKQMSYNYELGYKQTFLDGKIYADLSLFLSKIEGQQIARSVPSGRGTYFDNAGKSENKGVEISTKISNIYGFDLDVAYGYTKAEITKYEKNDSIKFNGNTAPYVPLHTLNITLAKNFKIKHKILKNIRLQANYKQTGHIYWRIENDLEQNTYGLINANVALSTKRVTLDFWAKNLSNTSYNVYMLSFMNAFYQEGTPRMMGVTASFRIN